MRKGARKTCKKRVDIGEKKAAQEKLRTNYAEEETGEGKLREKEKCLTWTQKTQKLYRKNTESKRM